jgi:hypothetical protein
MIHDTVQHRDAVLPVHQNTARYQVRHYQQLPTEYEEMNNAINQAGWHFPS